MTDTPRSPRRLIGRAPTAEAACELLRRYPRCLVELRPLTRGWLLFEVVAL